VGSIPLVIRGVRKAGDGEIPRQADLRSAGSLTGRDGQKAGAFYAASCCKITNPVQGVRAL
jgi:hypothetical protein